jgi:diguanylate cyclase (GGDEF)-like protein
MMGDATTPKPDSKDASERAMSDYKQALRMLKAEHAALAAERTQLDANGQVQRQRVHDLEGRIRSMHLHPQEQWAIMNQRMDALSLAPTNDRVYGYSEMAAALQHWQQIAHQLATQIESLSQLVRIDGLTELYNRRAFDEYLPREVGRAQRERLPVCVLMIDVDHFKRFNDRHGHPAGDAALRRVAHCIRSCIRPSDHAARYGGEEFVIVLSGVDLAQGRAVADRVRHQVELLPAEPQALSVSIGLAWVDLRSSYHKSATALSRGLLEAADQALYRAKRAGRNRVELANDMDRHLYTDQDTHPLLTTEDSITTQPMAVVPRPPAPPAGAPAGEGRGRDSDSLSTKRRRMI